MHLKELRQTTSGSVIRSTIMTGLLMIISCTSVLGIHSKTLSSAWVECNVSFPDAAVSNVNTIYIPFTLVGRLMVVQARIDTLAGNFIVDTGSERLLLNKDYVRDNTNKAVTAVGNTGFVAVSERQVDSLNIDQLAIYNILAHIVDLDHIELKKNTRILGILGYNVFQHFELFIDFQNSRIVLSRVDRKGIRLDSIAYYELPYDSLDFTLKNHLIVVETVVNGVKVEMFVDSGAELNLIDRRVGKKVLEKFAIIKRVNLIGVGKRQVEVLAGTLADVACGNQRTKSMNTLLTSLDEINTSFGTSVEGVLGYEFLHSRRTLINYQKRKLYFFAAQRS